MVDRAAATHRWGSRVRDRKSLQGGRPFGLSIVKSGPVTLITLVDEKQPPSRAGKMTFSDQGTTFGDLFVTPAGPAFATTEDESEQTWNTINRLPAQPLSIGIDGSEYSADLTGIDQAREQLKVCETEASR
ncbi:protein of unknown function [Hyphomicrobium sp. MC1]|nr:protein of unknown function [Hyphomicrobium sp. MC1]